MGNLTDPLPSRARYQMRAYEQLFALAQILSTYDTVTTSLRDNEVEVTRWTPGGNLRETITCTPRPSDGDRLWFWDSARRPVGEADHVTDSALEIARSLVP